MTPCLYIFIAVAAASVVGLSLGRVSSKHRTPREDRLDWQEQQTGYRREPHVGYSILDELKSYSGDGWMERHRRVSEEVRGGVDEIDRLYIESEGYGDA